MGERSTSGGPGQAGGADGRGKNGSDMRAPGPSPNGLRGVLFVCVHNAGRSQMAAAFLERSAGGMVRAESAGSEPADRIDPEVVRAMAEVGIDLAGARPRPLEPE